MKYYNAHFIDMVSFYWHDLKNKTKQKTFFNNTPDVVNYYVYLLTRKPKQRKFKLLIQCHIVRDGAGT